MAGTLFEYVVIHHPPVKKDQGGNDITEKSTVIVPCGQSIFKDQNEANLKVARMIPDKYADLLDECQVMVRPF